MHEHITYSAAIFWPIVRTFAWQQVMWWIRQHSHQQLQHGAIVIASSKNHCLATGDVIAQLQHTHQQLQHCASRSSQLLGKNEHLATGHVTDINNNTDIDNYNDMTPALTTFIEIMVSVLLSNGCFSSMLMATSSWLVERVTWGMAWWGVGGDRSAGCFGDRGSTINKHHVNFLQYKHIYLR